MNNQEVLQECCRQIALRMGWGHSGDWQRGDFETLSARIQEETGVLLSVSTLKRVWGKVKYDSMPSITTLNTLARFAGHAGWRELKQQLSGGEPDEKDAPLAGAPPRRKPLIWAAVLMLVLLAGWQGMRWLKGQPVRNKGAFSFSMEPLAKGIPNSVVFHYDAGAAGGDSVFIQQSWDPKRRFPVPSNGKVYTSIYYYPGHFKAKLLVGRDIVQEQDLIIPSEGWLTAVEQEPVPVYYPASETIRDGVLRLTPQQLAARNINMQPKPPLVKMYYIDHMKSLSADDFILETELRSEYIQGSAVCGGIRIVIHGTVGAYIIPLAKPGCVGDMSLMVGDTMFVAMGTDLSGLGCEVSEWVKVRCEVKGRDARIFVNGKEAFHYKYVKPAGELVGISYRFDGTGAVNSVQFSKTDGTVVFGEEF
ncbi:hypothetical protein [Chitinophaga deserti]|uniref:hypothetical protein n=1 Tax=Chitinophaga deserti TaxID=2164099 RepID=UPI0013004DA4|nr:hypothetical protein [Chitinophaga deserti]